MEGAAGWTRVVDEASGAPYWWHAATGEVSWTPPTAQASATGWTRIASVAGNPGDGSGSDPGDKGTVAKYNSAGLLASSRVSFVPQRPASFFPALEIDGKFFKYVNKPFLQTF